jgi:hypothetical protein
LVSEKQLQYHEQTSYDDHLSAELESGADFNKQHEKEEGYKPEEKTHMRKDLNYLAAVKVSKDKGFNVIFRAKPLDRVDIMEMLSMNEKYKKAYKALSALRQNSFYFDLKVSLLQMNVMFSMQKGIRELESIQVSKPIYFDGLTKDRFFDTIFTVGHAVEIVRTKLGQFRDSILPSQAGESEDWKGTI